MLVLTLHGWVQVTDEQTGYTWRFRGQPALDQDNPNKIRYLFDAPKERIRIHQERNESHE